MPSRAHAGKRRSRRRLVVVGLACMTAGLAGCASDSGSPAPGGNSEIQVVATTTIWGDIASQITDCAGTGTVTTLMPIAADPHDFSPSSQDITKIVSADLVVANGLGLEEGLAGALETAQVDGATVLEVAPQLDPMPFGAGHAQADDHAGDADNQDYDPHVWLDASRTAAGAQLIGRELASRTADQRFAECGDEVAEALTELHQQVKATLAGVPAGNRVLVTDHDSFGYFARAYDFDVVGTVVPGGSTLAKPSSADLAKLAKDVKAAGVPAIFSNTANPQALVEALAAEVGDVEVVELYEGSLGGPESSAATYQGLMTTNAERIAAALGGSQ